MRRLAIAVLLLAAVGAHAADVPVIIHGKPAPMPSQELPAYAPDGKLLFPADYREWIYLSTDFDLSYAEGLPPNAHIFGNVFVNREAYAAFRKTQTWPDKTMMVLEMRVAGGNNPLNKRGLYQAGAPVDLELHVKDDAKGGWGFYAFNTARAPAALLPKTASCYACHSQHGATDTTFTQFYPTLAEPGEK